VYAKSVARVLPKASLRENPDVRIKKFFEKMSYYAYILKSKSHGTFYYGHCEDLEKRLNQHNKGRVKYTKGRMPWKVHYFEIFKTRSEAMKREKYFKSIDGYKYLKSEGIT